MVPVSSQERPPFEWDAKRERAAERIAEGELTYDEIADEAEITRRALYKWRTHPEFAARVEEIKRELGDALLRQAIANRSRRLASAQRRWQSMHRILEERAADMPDIPGGESGMLVRRIRSIGSGDNQERIEEYEVDGTLLREMRELEKQAAIEVGQWAEKRELTGADGSPIPIRVVEVVRSSAPETP